VRDKWLTRQPDGQLWNGNPDAYFLGNTLYINQDDFSGDVILYYEDRPRDLHFGQAGTASGASALVFDTTMVPSKIASHYKWAYVEFDKSTGRVRSQISAYNESTNVATITGTAASGEWYGTETMLPFEAEACMVLKATLLCLAKPSSAIDPKYYEMYKDEYSEMLAVFEHWISDRRPGDHHVRITELD